MCRAFPPRRISVRGIAADPCLLEATSFPYSFPPRPPPPPPLPSLTREFAISPPFVRKFSCSHACTTGRMQTHGSAKQVARVSQRRTKGTRNTM